MSVDPDAVATAITGSDPVENPVVAFCGWVQDDNGVSIRIYDDPCFDEWFEIKLADVVHQVPGTARPHDEGRSAIWVRADAAIKKCRSGTALHFFEQMKRNRIEDPAGWTSGSRRP
jgi:hypothetical protein